MKKSFLLLLSCGALLASCGQGGASSDSIASSATEPSVDSSLSSSDSSSENPIYIDPDASSKKAEIRAWMTSFKEFEGNVAVASIHGYEEKGGLVELFCGYIGRKIYIEIADTGKGIENIERAREPLYTSKPEMERSGMGFTIMETFMEKVRIESRIGVGTRIFMEKTLAKE